MVTGAALVNTECVAFHAYSKPTYQYSRVGLSLLIRFEQRGMGLRVSRVWVQGEVPIGSLGTKSPIS